MNIKELIKTQQKLDAAMFKKAGITEYPASKIRLAYYVELAEALQEYQVWKYWKNNKKIDREKLLEEIADVLHFALSLEGYYETYEYNYPMYEGKADYDFYDGVIESFIPLANLSFVDDEYLGNTIALSLSLGFTREELVDAYYKKNKKNYERVNSGY